MDEKKVIFSGIQPSGTPTLGNYIGALRNWARLQEENDCVYCVVDLHAITVRQNPAELRRRCLEVFAWLLAVGISPEKSLVFFQSHVPQHAELAWVLNCYAYFGELSRMTQFKDKSRKHEENINVGLFAYPALMASDILLYGAHWVPVGEDQRQHVELTRDLALRFNNAYSETFVVPEGFIPKAGARVMGLTDPTRKMSKSDAEDSYIALLDAPEIIRKKVRRAVTDTDNRVIYEKERPGIANLMDIYAALTGESYDAISAQYSDGGYGKFKDAVADAIIAELAPLQAEYERFMADKGTLQEIMRSGAEAASRRARRTLSKVYRKIGLAPREL